MAPRPRKQLRSDISWSDEDDSIFIRGRELNREILGHMTLSGVAWMHIVGTPPTPEQERMFDALLIALIEHGVTPTVVAARMTLVGAPDSLQGAVAAGLLSVGSRAVGTMEGAAQMLSEALEANPVGADLDALAAEVVRTRRAARALIPGIGHPIHDPDPRATRLFELAAENGFDGPHIDLIRRISAVATTEMERSMPVNVTGAIGAIACEMGFPWQVARGIALIGRTIGLVGHLLEEMRDPMAMEVMWRINDEVNVPPKNEELPDGR
ncbi:MAG TPA: citryl-CoA lyase [Solirubrobacteraceae bacterium]|nr:citryl-CoA lyase [Solirubrobacteraceae bacterium]